MRAAGGAIINKIISENDLLVPLGLLPYLSGGVVTRFHEMKLGSACASGQVSSEGDPSALKICSSWFMSLLPVNQA